MDQRGLEQPGLEYLEREALVLGGWEFRKRVLALDRERVLELTVAQGLRRRRVLTSASRKIRIREMSLGCHL